ncbi:MAG: hypothetical protein AAGK37_06540 [Pseudomonadota bacterium]
MMELEDFDETGDGKDAQTIDADAQPENASLEAARVAGYEDGYKTGWDDAIKSADEDARNVSAELSRNLRDLSFTYFEARDEFLASIEPFLADFLDTMFPELLSEVAAAGIAADLVERVKEQHEDDIRILVSPEDGAVVRRLVDMNDAPPVEIVEEAALASGQAQVTSKRRDVSIDPGALLHRLRVALDVAPPEQMEMQAHG